MTQDRDRMTITMTLGEAARAVGGELVDASSERRLGGVSIDTRTLQEHDLFFALQGQTDGHQYLDQALARRAAAAVVQRDHPMPAAPARPPQIRVADPLRALGDLAAHYRRGLSVTVVGISGSNGKSTTKEMIARILAAHGPTAKTFGNFNNFIGVPLSILHIGATDRYAVIELGTSAPGEIARLAEIAAPDVGVITNIGATHLEGLGSIERVVQEKGALIEAVRGKTAVLNADDTWSRRLMARHVGRLLRFGMANQADVSATAIQGDETGTTFLLADGESVRLPLIGQCNVYNALAALAVAEALGVPPAAARAALAETPAPPMRMQREHLAGVLLVNDCYNANPASMHHAVAELSRLAVTGRRVFVCGDMFELGAAGESYHYRLGEAVVRAGIDILWTVGEAAESVAGSARAHGMRADRIFSHRSTEEASAGSPFPLRTGDALWIKGSRGMGLERVVSRLRQALGAQDEPPTDGFESFRVSEEAATRGLNRGTRMPTEKGAVKQSWQG